MTAVIPYSGYAPNQVIPLRIQVINESDQAIEKFSVKLIQVIGDETGDEITNELIN